MPSDIWKHFEPIKNEEKAKCTHCGKNYTHKKQSTKGLWDHLQCLHNEIWKKAKGVDDSIFDPQSQKIVPSKITSHFERLQNKVQEQEEAESILMRIMVRQNCSFYFYDDPDLKKLFRKAYPNLQVFGRRHFQDTAVSRAASKSVEEIVNNLGSKYFAITSDGWQKITKSPALLSITMHYIDNKFCRIDRVLAAIPVKGEHTADNYAKIVSERLEKNHLKLDKVLAMVRDDASTMRALAGQLHFESFQCAAHFLNLVISDVLKDETLKEMTEKCKKWVSFFRTNAGQMLLIRQQNGMNFPEKKIPMCVPTRWNSLFYMMQGIVEQRLVIKSIQRERIESMELQKGKRLKASVRSAPDQLADFTELEFETLKELCRILKPFDLLTKKLSEEQSTASSIIPAFKNLQDFLWRKSTFGGIEILPKIISEKLHGSISARFDKIRRNKILRISMIVDPRFAFDENVLLKDEWFEVENELIDFYRNVLNKDPIEPTEEQNSDVSCPFTCVDSVVDIAAEVSEDLMIGNELDIFGDENQSDEEEYSIYSNNRPKSPGKISQASTDSAAQLLAAIKVELANFQSIDKPDPNECDPFAFWKIYSTKFPTLTKAAQALLAIPATSVTSERLFSKAGLIYANTLRNRLSAEKVEEILQIKANLTEFPLQLQDVEDEEAPHGGVEELE